VAGSPSKSSGPSGTLKALDKWAYDNKVTLDFSWLGKPTDNPFIELFNGSFRDYATFSI
jgi:transposase InsO family protein